MTARRRALIAVACGLALLAIPLVRAACHLAATALQDRAERATPGEREVDDVSGLSRTRVAEVIEVAPRLEDAERQLAALVDRARRTGGKIAIAGARHSMGGQTREQLLRAYPRAERFFALKRRHDPDLVFQNLLYTTYAGD